MTTISSNTRDRNHQPGKPVHSGIRLINFIIDSLVWITLYFAIAYVFDLYFLRFNSYFVNYIYSISLGLLVYWAYYCVLEFYFQKTLGKLLSRTKVLSTNEGELSFRSVLIRTISRLIPIDFLYYFFSRRGLHDRLSNTLVVKDDRTK